MSAPAIARPQEHFSRGFDELRVGDSFRTGGRTITETDVVNFSVWTGDMLPSHIDRHWAAEHSLHGRRVANGLLVLSYTLGLLPIDHEHALALRRMNSVTFKRPTFLGDTVHAEGEITDLRRLDEFGSVQTRVSSVNQDGVTVVVGYFDMLWRLETRKDLP
ncbi:MaoC/PaaZ C-terminal domain-containing protein [Williamsia sterculiae]|uniref:Acyl dehydratase n=1 Tax=Williamsia sterculiae TaxID=1344003 RepID=A0A1N7DP45_9NOCA|nr:MaoC/PaaZ C-terminal domain-containing protein [Williamsia sterculiae]SIR77653.1 Acyl dehydratase [Williamsia sterculiae]